MKKTSVILCDDSRVDHGAFSFVRKRLGAAAGGQKLGASWFELQPGKKAFPAHYHLANEEAVFVLEGEGVLRYGDEEMPLRPGDYVAFPPGPPGRQVVNRGTAPLRYLALSTMIEPEVAVYPDSKKVGVLARSQNLASVHKQDDAVDYYEGEE
ncbi:MAG: cupin domain-containing protein [Myxococcales bacterium]|nr:cupin domain-containing protein [Myxococcales bacterium]